MLLKTRTEDALELTLGRPWDARTVDLPGRVGIYEVVKYLLLVPVLLGMPLEAKLLADLTLSLGMVGRLSNDARLAFEVANRKEVDVLNGIQVLEAGLAGFWGRWRSSPVGDLCVHYWKRQVASL